MTAFFSSAVPFDDEVRMLDEHMLQRKDLLIRGKNGVLVMIRYHIGDQQFIHVVHECSVNFGTADDLKVVAAGQRCQLGGFVDHRHAKLAGSGKFSSRTTKTSPSACVLLNPRVNEFESCGNFPALRSGLCVPYWKNLLCW